MPKTRVFRIEHHESSLGPYHHAYRTNDAVLAKVLKDILREDTPPVHEDTLLPNRSDPALIKSMLKYSKKNTLHHFKQEQSVDMLFCFLSIPQIRKWFGEDALLTLHQNGFNLVVYDTDRLNLVKFKKQAVLLNKDSAELIWKQNIVSLL